MKVNIHENKLIHLNINVMASKRASGKMRYNEQTTLVPGASMFYILEKFSITMFSDMTCNEGKVILYTNFINS